MNMNAIRRRQEEVAAANTTAHVQYLTLPRQSFMVEVGYSTMRDISVLVGLNPLHCILEDREPLGKRRMSNPDSIV